MKYDLYCPLLQSTFYIQCHLVDKPEMLGELLNGIDFGRIEWQVDHQDNMLQLIQRIQDGDFGDPNLLDMTHPLQTDFTLYRIPFYINWPKMENTK